MKRILLTAFTLIFSYVGLSQAQDKGAISIDAGYDGGVHLVLGDSEYKGATWGETDSSGAVTKMFKLDAHYNVLKFLSAGLHFRTGAYVEDSLNAAANGNKVNMFGVGIRLYPVNKDKFVWYIGTTLGASNLEINRNFTFIVTVPYKYNFKSSHVGFETGFNWYFAKNFGLNFGLGYSSQKYLMNEFNINGDPQDLTDWEHTLTTKGLHFNIGAAFHFGG